jgi:AraC-type DNA-binding domain-containing proteins
MDWLNGMNSVINHIEENLTQPIQYESLSRIVGCSVYEFSRIFSFMAGMSVSEYIRRRRLSQAVFDIQSGNEKIIDIALKYCYESPTTFTRAFKELHGTTPLSARKTSVSLKTYPPISLVLTIKGVNELKHRIEKSGWFGVKTGWAMFGDNKSDELGISIYNADNMPKMLAESRKHAGEESYDGTFVALIVDNNNGAFLDKNFRVSVDGGEPRELEEWYTRIYFGKIFEVKETDPPNGLVKIPPATWAVFTFDTELNEQNQSEAYARILTEWIPISSYKRDVSMPHMEQYETCSHKTWEIWIPIIDK